MTLRQKEKQTVWGAHSKSQKVSGTSSWDRLEHHYASPEALGWRWTCVKDQETSWLRGSSVNSWWTSVNKDKQIQSVRVQEQSFMNWKTNHKSKWRGTCGEEAPDPEAPALPSSTLALLLWLWASSYDWSWLPGIYWWLQRWWIHVGVDRNTLCSDSARSIRAHQLIIHSSAGRRCRTWDRSNQRVVGVNRCNILNLVNKMCTDASSLDCVSGHFGMWWWLILQYPHQSAQTCRCCCCIMLV